ncbi:hypothetical protein ILUMI_18139 [Ignelater luminosus]|uniref:Uncharacterized protein n=1 Tax=Ignelater luminosus TaxID=2038154 RepID=A0A8K0CKG4_IGNLU|nr:hypothetical protein ILUMI_18139 [Ignelater luminosus]
MYYGLSLQQLLTLAYEYAESLGCRYPELWKKNKCARKDWAAGLRKRNQALNLRKSENTSAARSFVFNKTAVTVFDNYERVMVRYNFTPDRIINLDETGVNTVLPTPKVLAEKKQRQVRQIVSVEREELVTFWHIVTATEVALSPVKSVFGKQKRLDDCRIAHASFQAYLVPYFMHQRQPLPNHV